MTSALKEYFDFKTAAITFALVIHRHRVGLQRHVRCPRLGDLPETDPLGDRRHAGFRHHHAAPIPAPAVHLLPLLFPFGGDAACSASHGKDGLRLHELVQPGSIPPPALRVHEDHHGARPGTSISPVPMYRCGGSKTWPLPPGSCCFRWRLSCCSPIRERPSFISGCSSRCCTGEAHPGSRCSPSISPIIAAVAALFGTTPFLVAVCVLGVLLYLTKEHRIVAAVVFSITVLVGHFRPVHL